MAQFEVPTVDMAGFDRYRAIYEREVTALTTDLLAGRKTVGEWRAAMLIEISYLVLMAFAAGKGGLKNLTDTDRAIIERKTQEQMRYIDRWAKQLRAQAEADGRLKATAVAAGLALTGALAAKVWQAGQPLSVAALVSRALLYVQSAHVYIQLAHGLALGLPELPVYPGERSECLFNCKCHWSIRHQGGRNWDCRWVLGVSEHCSQCINRATAFNPLKVVNGVIQPYSTAGIFI